MPGLRHLESGGGAVPVWAGLTKATLRALFLVGLPPWYEDGKPADRRVP